MTTREAIWAVASILCLWGGLEAGYRIGKKEQERVVTVLQGKLDSESAFAQKTYTRLVTCIRGEKTND